MDSALWDNLPKDLLLRVFARLPLPQLLSLRRSSLEEKWDVNLGDSEFAQLCAETHPSSCALIFPSATCGYYDDVVHGVMSTSWLSLKINVDGSYKTVASSCDGGLVCLALKVGSGLSRPRPLVIVVANPLTGDCRVLPGHGVHPNRLKMMQLEMDRDTNSYRVILLVDKANYPGEFSLVHNSPWYPRGAVVVHDSKYAREFDAILFHSGTGVWSNSKDSSSLEDFLGVRHMHVNPIDHSEAREYSANFRPQTFDCRTASLISIPDFKSRIRDHAFVNDRLFLIETGYDSVRKVLCCTISEHQCQVQIDGRWSWPKLKDHHVDQRILLGLNPFKKRLRLIACQGFLLVFEMAYRGDYGVEYENYRKPWYRKIALLYSLSTGDLLDLQKQRDEFFQSPLLMCELQWDVVP